MTDKQIIDVCPYQGECSVSGCKRYDDGCFVRQLFEERDRAEKQIIELNKTIQAKEQECEQFKKENKVNLSRSLDLNKELSQLSEENTELKAKNEKLKNAYTRLNSLYNDNCNFTDKLEQAFIEIKEIVKPHQRNIDKICGHCRRYDTCHACCIDDINCYQYKKPTTPACDKYCELKEFEINNMANQVLQKISEVEDV